MGDALGGLIALALALSVVGIFLTQSRAGLLAGGATAGIAVASNEVSPKDNTVNDRTGRSHVQLVGELLSKARSLGDAPPPEAAPEGPAEANLRGAL